MKKIRSVLLVVAVVALSAASAMAVTLYSEDFSDPLKNSNTGADGYLGTGGAGFNYNGNYGTWLYASGNMGIDDPAEGDESGTGAGNAISSIDHARAQDVRGLNARAVSMVLSGGLFKHGVQYTVSFDVYGDASGNDAGFYWLAELSGYDNSGSNYIQIDGTWGGWVGGANKPFAGVGTATVNFLSDYVSIDGENADATNTVSFTFTYDGSNSPDIAFAVGTYNNIFGIDNVEITTSGTVYEEDFDSPAKNTNAGADGYLGTGGAGYDYNGNFGTWLYNDGNMGIDNPAEGDGSGDSNNNAISSIGEARVQDERGGNARAVSVVLDGALFGDGVEYTMSFDVYGDASGNDAGRYWLAELYAYDTSGTNYIQIDGTQAGWASAKPFTSAGDAKVKFLKDSASNGVLIDGEDTDATNTVSFTFTYDASNSPDIAFAAGTYQNIFGIDNVRIAREFVDAVAGNTNVVFFGGDASVFDGSNFTNNLFVSQTDAGEIVQWNGVDSDGGSFGASGTLVNQGIGGTLTNAGTGLILTTVDIVPSGSNTYAAQLPNVLGVDGGDKAKFDAGEAWTFEFNKQVQLKQLVLSAFQYNSETVTVTVAGTDITSFNPQDSNLTAVSWEGSPANKWVYTYPTSIVVSAGTDITIEAPNGSWGLQGIVVDATPVLAFDPGTLTLIDFGGPNEKFTDAAYQSDLGEGYGVDEIMTWFGNDIYGRLGEFGSLNDEGVGGAMTSLTYNVAIETVAISSTDPASTNTTQNGGKLGVSPAGGLGNFDSANADEWTFEWDKDVTLLKVGLRYFGGSDVALIDIGGTEYVITPDDTVAATHEGSAALYTFLPAVEITAGTDIKVVASNGTWGLRQLLVGVTNAPVYPQTYDEWAATYGLAAGSETNNNDGDIYNNLFEFAQGGNPTNGNIVGTLPSISVDGGTVTYLYDRKKDYFTQDLVYTVEVTDDLVNGSWTNLTAAGFTQDGIEIGTTLQTVINTGPATNSVQFIRMSITK